MNWDALGAISELLGAIAVILTLIYLSIQIRQNTRSMDESRKVELARNRTQIVQLRSEWQLAEATSDQIIGIYSRLNAAGWPDPKCLDALSHDERAIYTRLQTVNLIINTNARYQFEQGLIDERTYSSSKRVIEFMTPIWRKIVPRPLLEGEIGEDGRE